MSCHDCIPNVNTVPGMLVIDEDLVQTVGKLVEKEMSLSNLDLS